VAKALPGWLRDKHYDINLRLGNKGRLDLDIAEYNATNKPADPQAIARRRADAHRDELALRRSLREVWE